MDSDSHSYPSLRFLGDESELRMSYNRLPHWQSGQTACFITFRLADSLPEALLADWRSDRDAWRENHPEPWDEATEMEYYERFSARIDYALDAGHGSCLLALPEHAAAVANTLSARNGTDYHLHLWVIMPNHVHILMSPNHEASLSRIVGGWKRFSATRIHKVCGTSGQLWQKDYFDRLIRDWNHFQSVAQYIRRNPSKARISEGRFVIFEEP